MTRTSTEMRQFWTDVGGPAWVAEQDALDLGLAPHDDALLAAANLAPGQRVLDAGCGAAAFTIRAADRVQPGGAMVGIDFSPPMLALARQRVEASGAPVRLVEADLAHWKGDGSPFDVVVSRLGLADSPPMLAALTEFSYPAAG